MPEKKQVLSYTLHFSGLFGRNRTAKRDLVELSTVPAEAPLTEDAVRALAAAKIASIKPKPGVPFRYQVIETPETHEDRGNGFIARSFMIASGRTVLTGTIPTAAATVAA